MDERLKKCNRCQEHKPVDQFHKRLNVPAGVFHICKVCRREDRTNYRHKNVDKALFNGARSRASSKGIEFTITIDDVIVPDICPALGIPIVMSYDAHSPNSPSLDRIDNTLGYIKGNVRVISRRANTIKNDATLEELRSIVKYVEESL